MSRSPRPLVTRRLRAAAALGGAVGLALTGGTLASATPSPSPTALASVETAYDSATQRLESAREQVSVAAEGYNEARIRLTAAEKDAKTATAKAARARTGAVQARSVIREHAVRTWQSGGLSDWEPYVAGMGSSDLGEIVAARSRARLASATGTANLATVEAKRAAEATARLRTAATAGKRAESAARAAAAKAESEATRVGRQRSDLLQQMARLRGTTPTSEQARMDGLAAQRERRSEEQVRLQVLSADSAETGESVDTGEAATGAPSTTPSEPRRSVRITSRGDEHQRGQEAAATGQVRPLPLRLTTPADSPSPAPSPTPSGPSQETGVAGPGLVSPSPRPTPTATPSPRPTTPAPASGAAAALTYAKAQVGKWYQWGGAGPNTFDCSGLTMMAWRQAGVYLSHGSQAQYRESRRVAIKDLQPGDLVFYGASPATNHHVGIYVGGGRMIEAPRTGYQVRYASIYRSNLLPYGGRP